MGRILALYSAASPGIVTAQLAVPALTSELGVSGRLAGWLGGCNSEGGE